MKPKAGAPFSAGFAVGLALGLASVLWLGSLSDTVVRTAVPLTPEEAIIHKSATPVISTTGMQAEAVRPVGIAAVGDVQLSRRVGLRIAASGWAPIFEGVRPLIEGADLAFCNLESPASTLGVSYAGKDPAVTFRADPASLFALKRAGFDLVSLANNHSGDFGGKALMQTLDALDALDIASSGAGANLASARKPALVEAAGKRIALLSYTEPMWSVTEAGQDSGVAIIRETEIIADLVSARGLADYVIISLHWGEEYEGVPRERDRAFARRLVDAGAAAILGHHPHVLQGVEFHRGVPILHSLGNFVFDMISPKTYESAIAYLRLGAEAPASVQLIPIRIDASSFAPFRATGRDAAAIGKLIAERCAALGTRTEILPDGAVLAIDHSPDNARMSSSMP